MELIERHTEQQAEIIERDGQQEITGWASVYYDGTEKTQYHLGDNLYERIQPGAFDAALDQRQNVQVRYNRSDDWVLSDTETGAVVKTDEKGLRYSVPFDPQDPQHQSVKAKIQKGLIRGSSFGAMGPQYRYTEEAGKHIAWLVGVKVLRDCGPVNSPAYKGAPALMRSEECNRQYREWLKAREETEKRLKKMGRHPR